MSNQNLASLKIRANRQGLILKRDRQTRNFVVNVRGSRRVYEGVSLGGVSGFLNRYAQANK